MSEERKTTNPVIGDFVAKIDLSKDEELAADLKTLIGDDFDDSALAAEDLHPIHLLVRFALADKPLCYATLTQSLSHLPLNKFDAFSLGVDSYTNCASTDIANEIKSGRSGEFIHVDEEYHGIPKKGPGPFRYDIKKISYSDFKEGCSRTGKDVVLHLPLDACDETELNSEGDLDFLEQVDIETYGKATRDLDKFTTVFQLDNRVLP
jgi:hypothetical protein